MDGEVDKGHALRLENPLPVCVSIVTQEIGTSAHKASMFAKLDNFNDNYLISDLCQKITDSNSKFKNLHGMDWLKLRVFTKLENDRLEEEMEGSTQLSDAPINKKSNMRHVYVYVPLIAGKYFNCDF